MVEDKLLQAVFEPDRWKRVIQKAYDKGINKSLLREMCTPNYRINLFKLICLEQYEIAPPHVVLIPKDKPGEFRKCKANEDEDRVILTVITDALCELFQFMVSDRCTSYQKGIGTQEVTDKSVKKIIEVSKSIKGNHIGYKADLSKYFDSVYIEHIDRIFNYVENWLRFKNGTEPVLNLLRKYYHSDWLFNIDGQLVEEYTSLKQGCAVASFLANVILRDIDDKLSEMCEFYVRYSDDMLIVGENADNAINYLEKELEKYGLKLNPRKVEKLYKDKWFTFLGFNIKGTQITLSPNRIKKFQKEIENRTIKKKINMENARKSVVKYMYGKDTNWATSCLKLINVEHDMKELNRFVKDCLRACKTGKKKLGGLGVNYNLKDGTIQRGTGKNVKENLKKVKDIENYYSIGCMSKNYKMSRELFMSCAREMLA